MRTLLVSLAVTLALPVGQLAAEQSREDLSQQAANPIADLMSIPLQNNTDFGLGPYDRVSRVLVVETAGSEGRDLNPR